MKHTWARGHWTRSQGNGSALAEINRRRRIEEPEREAEIRARAGAAKRAKCDARFEQWVVRSDPDACWGWTGPFTDRGYPTLDLKGGAGISYAYRRSFRNANGREKLPGMEIHHTCFSRVCTNPRHLVELTMREHRSLHANARNQRKNPRVS